jgi:O-antigen ligase
MEKPEQRTASLMPDKTENRQAFQTILIAVLLFFACWWYTGNLEQSVLLLTGACGFLCILGVFFYAFQWYYLLLVALIPYSIDFIVFGGAKLNFPAEGLLAMAIPVVLVFNKSYRNGLKYAGEHPVFKMLLVLLLLQLITGLQGNYIDVSIKRFVIELLFIAGFFGIVHMVTDPKKLVWFYLAYAIGLIPVMYTTLSKHIHYEFNPRTVFNICEPHYNDHTIYGACLAFIIPILVIVVFQPRIFRISGWMNTLLAVVLFFVIASEVLALSRAALLSIIVALLFYALLRYKMQFRSLIIGLGIAGSIVWYFHEDIYDSVQQNEAVSNDGELINHFSSVSNIKSDASNLERINRWICAWRMFEERPLLGFGPGTYQFEYNRFQTLDNKTYISTNAGDRGNAHSEYMTSLSEMGIGGLILFLIIVFGSIYYGMQNHYGLTDPLLKRINLGVLLGLITFYFHGIFNAFLDQSKMAFLVFTALGIIVWINLRLKHGKEEKSLG